ncbi:MAG TPA: hypothetical protein G4N95_03725 [Anaerolineae bacterium]|nr:hypothetical protein [Anaerolineae bacterium]
MLHRRQRLDVDAPKRKDRQGRADLRGAGRAGSEQMRLVPVRILVLWMKVYVPWFVPYLICVILDICSAGG